MLHQDIKVLMVLVIAAVVAVGAVAVGAAVVQRNAAESKYIDQK